MAQTTERVIKRIKQIREAKQRSSHDCAKMLDMPEEQYLLFEEGKTLLTLPEIELLAIYFRVPLKTFFNDGPVKDEASFILSVSILPKFTKIREKMIRAKFSILLKQVKLKHIHQAAGIPKETLQSYDQGDLPIPLDHLLQLSEALGIPIEELFSQEISFLENQTQTSEIKNWRLEYPSGDSKPDDFVADQYDHLINAIKKLPNGAQAIIAKKILEELKAL